MSVAKVPCTIVTGFLGAGKTTLVRHVLENADGRRLAVIVNEFGDVGIDGEILKSCGIESCPRGRHRRAGQWLHLLHRRRRFRAGAEEAARPADPPEHIVIETSGLALPKPLVKAFNWPEIASRVTVDGVIAVVDGAAVAAGRFADDPEAIARAARRGSVARPRQSARGGLSRTSCCAPTWCPEQGRPDVDERASQRRPTRSARRCRAPSRSWRPRTARSRSDSPARPRRGGRSRPRQPAVAPRPRGRARPRRFRHLHRRAAGRSTRRRRWSIAS